MIDASGLRALPGFIDVHVHAAGGGGEKGPASRTPAAEICDLIEAGITTLIGIRGTDSSSRSSRDLYAKLRELELDGLSTWMWTGSYQTPVDTLTGSIRDDVFLVDKIIGIGELALSDHRSSWPTFDELTRLVSDARIGGMISGKSGKTHFHLGSGRGKIDLLWEIVDKTEIPITQMYPTHMSRTPELVEETQKWINAGGYADFTADLDSDSLVISSLLDFKKRGVDLSKLTLSSDSYGSNPTFDSKGRLVGYGVGSADVLYQVLKTLHLNYSWGLDEASQFFTRNPAEFLEMTQKGSLDVGMHADILLFDEKLNLQYVFGKGQLLKDSASGYTKTSLFGQCATSSYQ